jgi:excisionase family DNA binding protein
MSTDDEFITSEELAKMLKMTERFVRRLVAERRITYIKVGRCVRFTHEAVAEYKARNTHRAVTRAELRRELERV